MCSLTAGAALLAGITLHHWWTALRSGRGALRWIAAVVCLGLGFLHLVLAPYRWVTGPIELRRSAEELADLVRSTPFADEGIDDQRTVFLTADFAACWTGFFQRRLERLPMPERWWILSMGDAEHRYHRAAPDRLVLVLMAVLDGRLQRVEPPPVGAVLGTGTETGLWYTSPGDRQHRK